MNWSLIYTFFRSLSLAHLERSLYSISRQTNLTEDLVFFENNTDFSEQDIKAVVAQHFDLNRWRFYFNKHGDPRKTTASWCQNQAIALGKHEVFILGKADLIYSFDFNERLVETFCYHSHYGNQPMHFTTCHLMQMGYLSAAPHETVDHAADLEPLNWREDPKRLHANNKHSQYHTQTQGDAASFCTTKTAMNAAGWYDEDLVGWSLWQLDLQTMMQKRGVQFHVIPEVLMYHMLHKIPAEDGERDLNRAHQIFNASSRRSDPKFQ